jgi:hypothetical protein
MFKENLHGNGTLGTSMLKVSAYTIFRFNAFIISYVQDVTFVAKTGGITTTYI